MGPVGLTSAPTRYTPELSQARQDRPRPSGRTSGARGGAAPALTDVFEQRWARDRIPTERSMMVFEVGLARRHLERATDVELDGVEASVKAAEAGVELAEGAA